MGHKRPIFWCFQGAEEFSRLALHLGPDRPLYGMRSGYLLMDSTEASCNALAQRYFEEIRSLEERGPYLIGGNCRGGGVAVEIARKLQNLGRHVLLLVLLDVRIWETFRGRLYPGKVAAYAGAYSRFNPYRQFRNPELGWSKLFSQGIKFELLPADHGQYFSDAVLPFFVGKLEAALQWAEGSTTLVSGNGASGGPLPQEAYRAGLHTLKKFEIKRAERRTIVVKVKNKSKVNWPAAPGERHLSWKSLAYAPR